MRQVRVLWNHALIRASLIVLLALVVFRPSAAVGQGPNRVAGWSYPTNLSLTAETASRYPAIAGDRMGNIHVVWIEEQGDQNGTSMIFYRMWDTKRWSAPVDIIVGNWMILPSLVVDSKGVLHLVYVSGSELMYSHAQVSGQPWSSKAWSKPVTIGSNIVARFPEILADAHDRLFVLYTADYTKGTPSVAIVHSDDGMTWSDPTVISNRAAIASTELSNVNRLAVSHVGTLYGIWGEGKKDRSSTETLRVLFSRSVLGGTGWSRPLVIADNSKASLGEALAVIVDSRERVHILWRDTDFSVVHQWSDDEGVHWSAPERLEYMKGMQRYGGLSASADRQGNIYLVYVLNGTLYALQWDGKAWGVPAVIATTVAPGDSSVVWPRLALTSGNELHVVWYEGFPELDEPNVLERLGRGEYEIRYSRRLLDLPRLQPEPFSTTPTSVPTPAAAAKTPEAAWTTTPRDVPTSVASQFAGDTQAPQVMQPLFLSALVPVLIIGAVLLATLVRRSSPW